MGMGIQTYIVGSETYPVGIRACRPTQWGSGHADYTVGMGTQTYPMEPWDLPSGEGRVNLARGVRGGGEGVARPDLPCLFPFFLFTITTALFVQRSLWVRSLNTALA